MADERAGIGEPGGARYNNAMIPKAFDSIQKADIEALRGNQVAEGRAFDYKLKLPGGSDEDKREFLADVSSFANAGGGDLIFGVKEAGGLPEDFPGVATTNFDDDKLRLENLIRDGLDPRVIGIQTRRVDGFASGPVVVIRIPRSFGGPHMVKFKNSSRFYTRNSAGKYQMDVVELRVAFEASGALAERLQRFRTDRVGKIVAGETPAPMPRTPKLILHLLPLSAYMLSSFEGVAHTGRDSFKPIGTNQWDHRINVDGLLTYTPVSRHGPGSEGYCQFFRNGAIESVWGDLVIEHEGRRMISGVGYEERLIQAVQSYVKGLKQFGVPLPFVITLSMVGVKGVQMGGEIRRVIHPTPIDRDALLLPDVPLDDYDEYMPKVMRPIFDAVWNSGGYERSPNYDPHGIWRPHSLR